MALSIGTSAVQLTLLNNQASNNKQLGTTTLRLSTGLRINSGKDDPAGLIGAEQIRGELIALAAQTRANSARQRETNVQQSGRRIATEVLQDVRGLLVEASDSFTSTEQRQAIQQQIDSSLNALDTLGSTTGFAVPAELISLRSGGSGNAVNGNTAEAIETLDAQLSKVNQANAAAGAYQKYTLDVEQRLAEDKAVIAAQALSQQEDADFATETSNLIKGKILVDASLKAMALSQRIQQDNITMLFDALI